tara:strand:+ start:124 stop:714 length:591 start_codon:yes stop_codon:yes gene_type:complete
MKMLAGNFYDVEKLIKDKDIVESMFSYDDGAYGHCISLPESGIEHHNNLPFTGALNHTPYFKEIYDNFETEIMSFRLLRRGPQSSYGLHNDKDIGEDTLRFQIPIISNDKSWLCTTNYDEIDEGWTEENSYDMISFGKRFEGNYRCYKLPVGRIYHFDTRKIHTLFNEGDSDRVTLLIDLKKNQWVDKFLSIFREL